MLGVSSGSPEAWVVRCKKCGCTINCRALDPHLEHSEPAKADPPPAYALLVTCACCWTVFRYSPAEIFKGHPTASMRCRERQARERQSNGDKKPNPAILVAASLIAAVRLNREEIKPSPIVMSKIAESIRLAEMIQRKLQQK